MEFPGIIKFSYCQDAFFESGVTSIFDSSLRKYVVDFLRRKGTSFLSVYIFSGESITEVCNVMMTIPVHDCAIIFARESVIRLLDKIYESDRVFFVSSRASFGVVKKTILRYLKRRRDESVQKIEFTYLESLVLSFLADGIAPQFLSKKVGLSVQTISRHKRNAMFKLGVRTTAELFLKYSLLVKHKKIKHANFMSEMSI
ncbi:helix-turn-helix transcriptional regulator [Enterobacter vonholyi]|uniref:helix-turn-helix transcriptional regulator n=1 Tax=Enterobacter vonholyi TaxID=2797505 RepID=UPI002665B9CD|nr:LuxR C-terminal-related transcriptional regulator [Enterobacter vonholyi]MDO2451255.1 LuxR C-terminal-related transcriptional regulator [Enterobacter vonholyi]